MKTCLSKEQEEELGNALGHLGKVYNVYRGKLGEAISQHSKDDWAGQLKSKGFPLDDSTLMYQKIAKLHESPLSLEHFHKSVSAAMAGFLGKPLDLIADSDPVEEYERRLRSEVRFVAGDKIKASMCSIRDHLKRELDRATMTLLLLYEDEENSLVMKEKRIKGLLKYMKHERYVNMDLATQIAALEEHRRDLTRLLAYFALPRQVLDQRHEDFLEEFLRVYGDSKDFIYSAFEDRLIDVLIDDVLSAYKQSSFKAFVYSARMASYKLYARDFSFTLDRYFTGFLVKGSSYISNKKAMSHISDPSLISCNLLEAVCGPPAALRREELVKYSSNQYFDNLTISPLALDAIYHSYACNPPKVILMLKNLFGAFLDEVDNSDNLVYDNPLEAAMSILFSLRRTLRDDLFSGAFGPSQRSIITAEMAHIRRPDFISSVMVKFDTSAESLARVSESLAQEFEAVFKRQARFIQFYDYDDIEKLMVFSDRRFKMKDKNNPNQHYLDELNHIDVRDIIRIKHVPSSYEHVFASQRPADRFRQVVVHPRVATAFDSLFTNSFELYKERLEVYCQRRQKEVDAKPRLDTSEKELPAVCKQLFEASYTALTAVSRNYLIRILSFINYSVSVRLAVERRSAFIRDLMNNYEAIEDLRYFTIKDTLKNSSKERDPPDFIDDSKLDSARHPSAANSHRRRYSFGKSNREDPIDILDEAIVHNEKTLAEINESAAKPTPRQPVTTNVGPGQVPEMQEFKSIVENSSMKERLNMFRTSIKNSHVFDDHVFTSLGAPFWADEDRAEEHAYIKVIDHLDKEIVYDSAINEFELLIGELKQTLSFYIQHSLVDYCFDSIVMGESVSTDIREPNSNLTHTKFDLKPSANHLNYEFLVSEVLKHECSFQQEKALLIREYTKAMDNAADIEAFHRYRRVVEKYVARRYPRREAR